MRPGKTRQTFPFSKMHSELNFPYFKWWRNCRIPELGRNLTVTPIHFLPFRRTYLTHPRQRELILSLKSFREGGSTSLPGNQFLLEHLLHVTWIHQAYLEKSFLPGNFSTITWIHVFISSCPLLIQGAELLSPILCVRWFHQTQQLGIDIDWLDSHHIISLLEGTQGWMYAHHSSFKCVLLSQASRFRQK